jgi:hypothetical protein
MTRSRLVPVADLVVRTKADNERALATIPLPYGRGSEARARLGSTGAARKRHINDLDLHCMQLTITIVN